MISQDISSDNSHAGAKVNEEDVKSSSPRPPLKKLQIVWRNVTLFAMLHVGALYGAYLFLTKAKWQTCFLAYFLYLATAMSVTAGAHRLWAHKAYKAKLPLRMLLVWFFTMAFQNSVFDWVRDHRMHHKYCDTDADPHNAERGFFFSHMGWLMVRKHPDIKDKGRNIEMNDLMDDPLLRFQHKHYLALVVLLCFVFPTYLPTLWGEQPLIAFYVAGLFRYTFTLHVTWLVNSAAHMWGTKPYDNDILAVETKVVSVLAVGEGFHNYHHTFPWDYKTAELGGYSFNWTKIFIDMMAKIGWAYDLKSVSEELIEKRVKRTGDGTHPMWGWDDQDLHVDDRNLSNINFEKLIK